MRFILKRERGFHENPYFWVEEQLIDIAGYLLLAYGITNRQHLIPPLNNAILARCYWEKPFLLFRYQT